MVESVGTMATLDLLKHEQVAGGQGAAARLRGLLMRYIRISTAGASSRQRRGHEIVNFVSLATVVSNTGLRAAVFTSSISGNFWPFVAALLFFSLVWLATPLMHRFGHLAAGTYLWGTAMAGDAVYAWIAGTDAGFRSISCLPVPRRWSWCSVRGG